MARSNVTSIFFLSFFLSFFPSLSRARFFALVHGSLISEHKADDILAAFFQKRVREPVCFAWVWKMIPCRCISLITDVACWAVETCARVKNPELG